MTRHTQEQIDALLNGYFRNTTRPMPWVMIAATMSLNKANGLDALLWKLITGYNGRDPDGTRRQYTPGTTRRSNQGNAWRPRELEAMQLALGGEGQRRTPPVDAAYIAGVLGRTPEEVAQKWAEMRRPFGRTRTLLGG